MSKLKSKGKTRAESVAPAAADSVPSHHGSAKLDPAEQQAVDGFLDLLARLIARAHLSGTLTVTASRETDDTDVSKHRNDKTDGNGKKRRRRS